MARLAFLIPDMRGGGAERVALTLIEALLARGHEVDLVLMHAEGELVPLLPVEARVFELGARRFRSAVLPLAGYLRERRPDVLLASLWPLTVAAVVAARLSWTGTRVITSDHSILSKQYGASRWAMALLRLSTRLLYPLADARICVSEGCAADLAHLSGLSKNSFTVIPNPVAPPPAPLEASPEVEALWPPGSQRILTVGSLKPVKNHLLLIRALALVNRERDVSLMILGEGPLRPRLERLAQELGVAERVVMPGFATDPWPFYASANLFALSSNFEGFGNVLVEAMLAGLPVVSTDCPTGPREILDGGPFGRLAPVGDAAALANAMAAALDEPHDPEPGREQAKRISGASVERYLRLLLEDEQQTAA